ncbi:MAG: MiaB/RimO family radical SAM methylthiotransferase [Deltaproteobacteria bacterium]|nr:MiaB/RimO family radical SAM methylthiotransferase [Deltaproteobacteria bacterium]
MKIFIRSMGCKVNQSDLAELVEGLVPFGLELVNEAASADAVLLNTCTVTHKADRDVRKILGALERDHPELPVLVAGCAVRVHAESLAAYSNVHAVFPPGKSLEIQASLRKLLKRESSSSGESESLDWESGFARLGRSRAFVKVQDGCQAFCSYCIIPSVRGPQRSLDIEDAVSRVGRLVAAGHGEVLLCGIHLGRYGIDLRPRRNLPELIEALDPVFSSGGARLRLSSVEPMEWSADLLARISERPWVCRHFHVPLQSLDDGILKAMGRPYRAEQACEKLASLHEAFPDALIGTDLLVGFPGETEAQARSTMTLLEEVPVAHFHVFTYSSRPGTPAAEMPLQVEHEKKRRWAAALRAMGQERWIAFLKEGLNRRHMLLLERVESGWAEGRTEHYRPVRVNLDPGQLPLRGSLLGIRAEKLVSMQLEGVVSGLLSSVEEQPER